MHVEVVTTLVSKYFFFLDKGAMFITTFLLCKLIFPSTADSVWSDKPILYSLPFNYLNMFMTALRLCQYVHAAIGRETK